MNGKLNISVSDTGVGIDTEEVYQKALKKGLIKLEDTEDLKRDEKLQLVFLPGYSTKDVATELSGRGVGLDVVKNNVQRLEGNIEIKSTPGKGTTFNLSFPIKT